MAMCHHRQSNAKESLEEQSPSGAGAVPKGTVCPGARGNRGRSSQLQMSSVLVTAREDGRHESSPGEMKKVLASFLSVVMSRISFVILTKRPETGGIRRKSRILKHRTWNHYLADPGWFSQQVIKTAARRRYPLQQGGRGGTKEGALSLPLCCHERAELDAKLALTCPGGRLQSPRCAARSPRSRRSRWGSPGPGSAWEERRGLGVMAMDGVTPSVGLAPNHPSPCVPGATGDTTRPSLLQSLPAGWCGPKPPARPPRTPCSQPKGWEVFMD